MSLKRIPPQGFSIQDIAELAIENAVQIHFGVHKTDIGEHPPTITIQVSDPAGTKDPEAFRMVITKTNPRLGQAMSANLLRYVDQVRPKRMRIIGG